MQLVSLKEEQIRTQTHTAGRPCEGQRKKAAICEPRRKASEEINLADTLISVF